MHMTVINDLMSSLLQLVSVPFLIYYLVENSQLLAYLFAMIMIEIQGLIINGEPMHTTMVLRVPVI